MEPEFANSQNQFVEITETTFLSRIPKVNWPVSHQMQYRETVDREACIYKDGNDCGDTVNIKVKYCVGSGSESGQFFYVYKFPNVPQCPARYCGCMC